MKAAAVIRWKISVIKHELYLEKCDDVLNSCSDFLDKYKYVPNFNFVVKDWYKLFKKICKLLGISKGSSKVIFYNFNGNYKTDEEKAYTCSDWWEKFRSDLFYCSDRWSFTRLLRVHWKFIMLLESNSLYIGDYQ